MKSLTAENAYPFALGAASGLLSWCLRFQIEHNVSQIFVATVTLGAISFGFVGTSLSILTSLDTPIMQRIRATRYRVILKRYLGWALFGGCALSAVGIAGLVWGGAQETQYVWVATLVFCFCCLWRVARTMLEVFADRENVGRRPE